MAPAGDSCDAGRAGLRAGAGLAREAERLHRDRYHAAEMIYLAEVGPKLLADLIIDNGDLARPVILGGRDGGERASREEPR